jgi:hypothetical protein
MNNQGSFKFFLEFPEKNEIQEAVHILGQPKIGTLSI